VFESLPKAENGKFKFENEKENSSGRRRKSPIIEIMTTPRKVRPKDITEYIHAAPKEAQKKLREMRACIRKSAPGAKESLKWGMPAFSYGRILVTFAVFPHHIGFYPTPSAVKAFAKELSKYVTASASVQFPLEKPLPFSLIRKITAFRVRENVENDGKWRT
jgi:uncharacterized protein YdhG (YjbR/CyaY superfamily)